MNDLKPKNPVEEIERYFDEDNMMNMNGSAVTLEQCLKIRKEEAQRINPDNAEVRWWSKGFMGVPGLDIDPEIAEYLSGEVEHCFARNPGSEIWVGLGELPRETQRRVWEMRRSELHEAFLDTPMHDGSGLTIRQWLQVRKDEAMRIDPETAEVHWSYEQAFDPYRVGFKLPDVWRCVGREYFARNPGSDIWVVFQDLPEGTRNKLWEMHSSKLAFPAGLPVEWFGT